jgi:transposase
MDAVGKALLDENAALKAELAVARAKASEDMALIAAQKLQIAKLERQIYGQKSERSARLLEQLALMFEELEASATEDEIAAEQAVVKATTVAGFTRKRPDRNTFPEHLPRERVVIEAPTSCACCGGHRLRKLGEDVTQTLETTPRQWKVIETVREKFSCRDCEKITQPPAPFHVVPRGWAGPSLLAMIAFEKFGQHQPLNRQAERYALEGAPIALSTMADAVGAICAALEPLRLLIEEHVLAAERLHGDDTIVPVLAKGKTDTGRCWVYVRDDAPFGGVAHLPRSSITRAIAKANIRRPIWRTIPAFCKRTPMTATTSCMWRSASLVRFSKRRVGRTRGGRSSSWPTSMRTPVARRRGKRRFRCRRSP